MSFNLGNDAVTAILRRMQEAEEDLARVGDRMTGGETSVEYVPIYNTAVTLLHHVATILDAVIDDGYNEAGLYVFDEDPRASLDVVEQHIRQLEAAFPASGDGGTEPGEQGEPGSVQLATFNVIPWRAAAGVVALGLAAWGAWRLVKR